MFLAALSCAPARHEAAPPPAEVARPAGIEMFLPGIPSAHVAEVLRVRMTADGFAERSANDVLVFTKLNNRLAARIIFRGRTRAPLVNRLEFRRVETPAGTWLINRTAVVTDFGLPAEKSHDVTARAREDMTTFLGEIRDACGRKNP
ncbi:MAG: hypothetical protein V1809_07960 [Planctomycetota bacterium]